MLRKFLIIHPDREMKHPATLTFDEATRQFGLNIPKEATRAELPAILNVLSMKGQYHVGDREARMFVRERIIPPERQNIGEIMRIVGITAYDEFAMLVYNDGRCAQDDFILEEIRGQ